MPAVVIPFARGGAATHGDQREGSWSLLEIAQPGRPPVPFGILFFDEADDRLEFRVRDAGCLGELDEAEADIFGALESDLALKGGEMGGRALLLWFEDQASNFFRTSDRATIQYTGTARDAVERLFAEHVVPDRKADHPGKDDIIPFVTHLPLYGLRAAATKFGEMMESEQEGWVRAPERLRLTAGMFVAQVVGRSMEPRIPDGSFCIFRAPVTGSRQGRLVLIEKLDETDFAWRYTVKRYAAHGPRDEEAERMEKIRLEPLNKEFEAFDLEADRFRVIAEFVQVLSA
jgi:SOS-response transcriptional repressor LexA